jgi:hypothetical protein
LIIFIILLTYVIGSCFLVNAGLFKIILIFKSSSTLLKEIGPGGKIEIISAAELFSFAGVISIVYPKG